MFLTTGQQIKQEREAHKRSQQEVATYVGYSRPLVADWEADRAMPNDRVLKALSELWRITIIKRTQKEANELNNAKSFAERMKVVRGNESKPIEPDVIEQQGEIDELKDLIKCKDEKIEQDRKTIERLKMKLKEETEAKESAENKLSGALKDISEYRKANVAMAHKISEMEAELKTRKTQQSNSADLIVELAQYKNAFAKLALEKMGGK